jgi:hypothetical protein
MNAQHFGSFAFPNHRYRTHGKGQLGGGFGALGSIEKLARANPLGHVF